MMGTCDFARIILHTQAIEVRHAQVRYHDVGPPVLQNVQRLVTIGCCSDAISPARQRGLEHTRDLPLVVHDQNVPVFRTSNHKTSGKASMRFDAGENSPVRYATMLSNLQVLS
jgi:hypothetical protein